ncbi:hypothetical protein [Desulfosporosinus sp. BG]|uniref:hypothetical protein n=1 Tax=Desulfosporosinus sp. BG TaxID=1633135 RepID=UPI00083B03BD|nr:hypothetical protein [Desulfosporosinus sp. BG]
MEVVSADERLRRGYIAPSTGCMALGYELIRQMPSIRASVYPFFMQRPRRICVKAQMVPFTFRSKSRRPKAQRKFLSLESALVESRQ